MMICSIKIGEELSAAALTRGLGAPVRRTNICKIGFKALDIIEDGFTVNERDVGDAQEDVLTWLEDLNLEFNAE